MSLEYVLAARAMGNLFPTPPTDKELEHYRKYSGKYSGPLTSSSDEEEEHDTIKVSGGAATETQAPTGKMITEEEETTKESVTAEEEVKTPKESVTQEEEEVKNPKESVTAEEEEVITKE
jgi:hypothetical protein